LNKTNIHNLFSLFVFALLLLSGCKKQEKLADSKNMLKNRNLPVLLDQMEKAELTCDWLSAKASVNITRGDKSNSFRANIRMKTDSVIWMSFTGLGVEAGRLLLTPDSVKVLNRLEGKFFVGDFSYIQKAFAIDADFETIQALILGNSLEFEREEKELKSYPSEGKYMISGVKRSKVKKAIVKDKELKKEDKIYSVWLNPITYKIEKQALLDFETDQELIISFSDFKNLGKHLFAEKVKINAIGKEEISVELGYYGLDVNEPKKISFKIPERYEPMF